MTLPLGTGGPGPTHRPDGLSNCIRLAVEHCPAYVAGRPGDVWEDRDRVLSLTSLSFAYPTVGSDHRAQLSLPGTALHHAYHRLAASGYDAFLLSTCLRVEIAWAADPETESDVLACLYGDGSVSDLGVVRTDETAFVHLCRVAAGLDSPLVGEPEVLGQFRHALSVYHEATSGSGSLRRSLETAIGIGRTARRQLGDAPRGSLAALAASAAAPYGRVAILGAGGMARAAAERLDGIEVTIFARRPGHVAGRDTLAWEAASEALANHPVVISTVPGKVPLFTENTVARAFAVRDDPLLLIDLGMPPGFVRSDAGDSVRYIGVDELASSINGRPSAEAAVAEEVQRFANRLPTAADPERVLKQLAHTVARRVLHPPISFLGSTNRGVEAVEVLADAFGIDDE
ncbi:MAG TPA: hypothetical protein VFY46_02780 [Acidimicrobiia bacterium]|nr:hypothetical protein [Acidimicrobiia bacterium]